MKKLLYLILVLIGVACCSSPQNEYVIKGSTSQERLEGELVFLVPYGSPTIEDSIGVDSTEVRNGKFEFRGHKGEFLARITMHRKVRMGTQDLLVVTEPGEIAVVIDSISSGKGTPQNDALQTWKNLKTEHDNVQWNQSQKIKRLQEQGDTVYAKALADSLKTYNDLYLTKIQDILGTLPPGPAYELLHSRYFPEDN